MSATKTTSALEVLRAAPSRDDAWEQVGRAITLFEYEQKARDKRDAKIRESLCVAIGILNGGGTTSNAVAVLDGALALLDGGE